MPADAALVEVCFEPAGVRAAVPPGTTLLAAGEKAGIDIPTGCQRGMCGTDPVRITAGAAALEPAADPEKGTLERMGLGPEYRLSCSARVRAGDAAAIVVELDAF